MKTRRPIPSNATLRARERCLAILDELKAAGLIDYTIGAHRPGEPGPHLEVTAMRSRLGDRAPAGVSRVASEMWELLRTGRVHDLL